MFTALTLKYPTLAQGKETCRDNIESVIDVLKKNYDTKFINEYTDKGKVVLTQVLYERTFKDQNREFEVRFMHNSRNESDMYVRESPMFGRGYDFRDSGANGLKVTKKNSESDLVMEIIMRNAKPVHHRVHDINTTTARNRVILEGNYTSTLSRILKSSQFNAKPRGKVETHQYKIEEYQGC